MPVKAASPGAAGCLSLVAFCLSPLVGSTLAMPATALYIYRHHPSQLDKSDHWLLFTCLALPLAGLIALWSARRRGKLALTVTVRAATLLVVAFVVTLWTLEHYAVPVELLSFVPILTGWAAILISLMLVPVLNRLFPAPWRERVAAPEPRSASPSRPYRPSSRGSSRSSSSPGGRRSRRTESPRQDGRSSPRSRDGRAEYRSRDGQPQNRTRDGQPEYRSRDGQAARDGQPQYRKERPAPARGEGASRHRSDAADRSNRPEQGDGKPQYRAEPPPPRRPSGDGKPVYRDD